MERLVGTTNVFSATGANWKRQRQVMNPHFKSSQLKSYFPHFNSAISRCLVSIKEQLASSSKSTCLINVFPLMTKFSLEAFGQALFGIQFGCFESKPIPGIEAYHAIMAALVEPIRFIRAYNSLPLPSNKKVDKAFAIYESFIEGIVTDKIASYSTSTKPSTNEDTPNLLDALLSATLDDSSSSSSGRSSSLSADELIANVKVFFVAGQETTASGLTSAMWYLASNPQVQAKIREEVIRIAALNETESEVNITSSMYSQLTYTQAVVKETLRLSPPIPAISRQAEVATELGGYYIEKGTVALISTYSLQRMTEYWGVDATEFKPERWLANDNIAGKPFYPFSYGNRVCIGHSFARMEMTCFLAKFLLRHTVEVHDPIKWWTMGTIHPQDGAYRVLSFKANY